MWIITGGAGYIGSHVAHDLIKINKSIHIIDNFSNGYEKRISNFSFSKCDIENRKELESVFKGISEKIDGIVHLAALKSVEESMTKRNNYFKTNVIGFLNILELSVQFGVENVIFSSSAAVYGEKVDKNNGVFNEKSICNPTSFYGENKLLGEKLLRDFSIEYGINGISLRYFNVLGSGYPHIFDTSKDNVLPKLHKALKTGEPFRIYGKDYDTPDGTCVRDYIHVSDLSQGHVKAVEHLSDTTSEGLNVNINLGSGKGYSVLELVDRFKKMFLVI
jgi:UDP-glucose 4-epimerase